MSILLCSNPIFTTFSSSSSSSSTLIPPAATVSRLQWKPVKLLNGVRFQSPIIGKKLGSVIVKASTDVDRSSPADNNEPPAEKEGKVVPIEKLPLESKLQERMEQKLKMKLAKKIRLRRKRLVRKRRMRKKGRWPPSKMKKLKNV